MMTLNREITARLGAERAQIVRLCQKWTGDAQTAEDLAQETLLAAWKSQERLASPAKLRPWLAGIARNVYLNWARKHYREQAYLFQPNLTAAYSAPDSPASQVEEPLDNQLFQETTLELEMDRAELARLFEKALSLLPAWTAQLLVEHYIQGSSHAQIAEKFGIKPGTAAVRLLRAKLALQRLLRMHLQEEAAAFGLVPPKSASWEVTNIWCPSCGHSRLLGQFQRGTPDDRFFLRCPVCHPGANAPMVGLDLTRPYYADLLAGVKTYKPAYTRLVNGLAGIFYQALGNHPTACPACGRPVVVDVAHDQILAHNAKDSWEILVHCSACQWASNMSLSGLVLSLPETQRFWRENPRLRTLPPLKIEVEGGPAYLTRMQSMASSAELAVISRHDTFAPIGIHTNIRI